MRVGEIESVKTRRTPSVFLSFACGVGVAVAVVSVVVQAETREDRDRLIAKAGSNVLRHERGDLVDASERLALGVDVEIQPRCLCK